MSSTHRGHRLKILKNETKEQKPDLPAEDPETTCMVYTTIKGRVLHFVETKREKQVGFLQI